MLCCQLALTYRSTTASCTPLPLSSLQGVAFDKIPYRTYYPAVSCYGGGRVRANFGPTWLKPPPGAASVAPAANAPGKGPGTAAATGGSNTTGSSSNSNSSSQPAMLLSSHGGAAGGAQPSAAHVGAIRAVAELKPLPKLEAAEHARAVRDIQKQLRQKQIQA